MRSGVWATSPRPTSPSTTRVIVGPATSSAAASRGFRQRAKSLVLDSFDGESHAVLDAEEAAALLPELVLPGDVVLVKASRGVGLEVVTEALQAAG